MAPDTDPIGLITNTNVTMAKPPSTLIPDTGAATATALLGTFIPGYSLLSQQEFMSRIARFVAGTRAPGFPGRSRRGSNAEEGDGDLGLLLGSMANFNTYWAKSTARDRIKPLHFTPSDGTHYFWFRNRPLAFIRYSEDNQGMGHGGLRALERPSITYIGRNPAILKDLLLEAQHSYVAKDANNTVIYRFRSDMGSAHWFFSMARPLRPLSTVILDLDHKERLITNIKEYLHPGTRRWYRIAGFRIDGNTSFMGHLEQGRQVCALL